MPRSFLVKRNKPDSENETSSTNLAGDESTTKLNAPGSQIIKPDHENTPNNNWYIEYHPTVSHFIPAKRCDMLQHTNGGSCYLCSCPYQHLPPPPLKSCIKYAPSILTEPPHSNDCNNNTCYCPMCRHKVAQQVACNCASCLRLRHPMLPPGIISHHTKLPLKPPMCCNGMNCDHVLMERSKYPPFCHCEQCVKGRGRLAIETLPHNEYIVSRTQSNKTASPIVNGENKHVEKKLQNKDLKENSELRIQNGVKSDEEIEEQQHVKDKIIELGKRRLEEPIVFDHKRFKCETEREEISSDGEEERQHDEIQERRDYEKSENGFSLRERVLPAKLCKQEEKDGQSCDKNVSEIKEENSESESTESLNESKDTDSLIVCDEFQDNNNNNESEIKRVRNDMVLSRSYKGSRRRYNTRHTTTKSKAYETDYIIPVDNEWKQDKDSYNDATKSRQKTKLNRLLANEHERRRVAQLNGAYQDLRQLIPGYQCDTKLPKIKILRYAINYIAHLDNILSEED